MKVTIDKLGNIYTEGIPMVTNDLPEETKEIMKLGLERAYRWRCQAYLRGEMEDMAKEQNAVEHLELVYSEMCPAGYDLESWLGWGKQAKAEIIMEVMEL